MHEFFHFFLASCQVNIQPALPESLIYEGKLNLLHGRDILQVFLDPEGQPILFVAL